MPDETKNVREPDRDINHAEVHVVVDRAMFQAELDALRARERAHTREGDAIAAARRRLPMVEVDSTPPRPTPPFTGFDLPDQIAP